MRKVETKTRRTLKFIQRKKKKGWQDVNDAGLGCTTWVEAGHRQLEIEREGSYEKREITQRNEE